MRRIFFHALTWTLLITSPAMAQRRMIINGEWEGGMSRNDPMPQLVQSTLQLARSGGMDNWAWRDTVEDRLVTLGPGAAGYMQGELAQRDGFEADALQVAMFRLENSPLVPKDSLQRWGEKHFSITTTPGDPAPSPLKIARVMDSRDGAGLIDIFPHHLFYVLEYKKTRLLVALAADAKIQALEDDAAIAQFMRAEATPQLSVNDKTHLASVAALLMLARSVTPYRPQYLQENLQTDLHTYKYTLQFEGFRQTATLTFTPAGMLSTLSSGAVKPEEKPAAPLVVPTTTIAPPTMPE